MVVGGAREGERCGRTFNSERLNFNVTINCNSGVRAVWVAGSPALRSRCAEENSWLADATSALSVVREVLEVAESAQALAPPHSV